MTAADSKSKRIDSNYYIEGYATTFDEPYLLWEDGDIKIYEKVDRHALDGVDLSDVILQFDHQGRVFARVSNGTLGLEPDEKGLLIWGDLSKSSGAKDLYEDVSNRLIVKMSWGFIVAEDRWEVNGNIRTRIILRIKKVYDVSAVSIPANDYTSISARNFVQGRLEAEQQELLERRAKILKIKILLEEQKQ